MIAKLDQRVNKITSDYAKLMCSLLAETCEIRDKHGGDASTLTEYERTDLLHKSYSLALLTNFMRNGEELCLEFSKGTEHEALIAETIERSSQLLEFMKKDDCFRFFNGEKP